MQYIKKCISSKLLGCMTSKHEVSPIQYFYMLIVSVKASYIMYKNEAKSYKVSYIIYISNGLTLCSQHVSMSKSPTVSFLNYCSIKQHRASQIVSRVFSGSQVLVDKYAFSVNNSVMGL